MEEVGRVTEIVKLTKRSVSDYRSAERQDARLRERREQESMQRQVSTGAKVRGGIAAAGCVLYVPTSSLVAEKALRGSFSFAVRISALVEKVAVQPYKVLLTRCSHATPRPLHSTS